jgi:ribonuclease T1
MNNNSRKYLSIFSVILLAVCLIVAFSGCSDSTLNNSTNHPEYELNTTVKSDIPSISQASKGVIRVSDLPIEARKTMLLIENGGPFPYSNDGAVFNNYEGLLPEKPSGYYHEYTVITPGSPDRGGRRIVSGGSSEYYYTNDHYSSFKLIQE